MLQMCMQSKVPEDIMMKILSLCPPSENNFVSFNEFKVIFHLIYKSYIAPVPQVLPESLKRVLVPVSTTTNTVNTVNSVTRTNEFDFGGKLGMNLSLGNVQQSIVSNVAEINQPKDMESILLNEFNLKNNIPFISNTINSNTPVKKEEPLPFSFPPQQTNPSQSYQPAFESVTSQFNSIHKEAVQENTFLTKVHDEDNMLLNNLLEDLEKINKNINNVNHKNGLIKEQITEIRRRINLERDNISKAMTTLNQKTGELISNQDELMKTMEIYNNVKQENAVKTTVHYESSSVSVNTGNTNTSNNISPMSHPSINKNLPSSTISPTTMPIYPQAQDLGMNFPSTASNNNFTFPKEKEISQQNNDFNFDNNHSSFINTPPPKEIKPQDDRQDTEFNFDKFEGNQFKNFAAQKGEEMFKQSAKFDADGWDF